MLKQFTHLDFKPHLQTIFTIHYSENGAFEADLIGADTIGKEPDTLDQRWAFSLVFQVKEPESYLQQKIYTITHPVMGSFEIFLVPLGPYETGFRYEAVFT